VTRVVPSISIMCGMMNISGVLWFVNTLEGWCRSERLFDYNIVRLNQSYRLFTETRSTLVLRSLSRIWRLFIILWLHRVVLCKHNCYNGALLI
jgi:hypothetical protein